ncbi:MAG TPA: hypothetical protein VGI40_18625 [Pirellulaceae bacterium]
MTPLPLSRERDTRNPDFFSADFAEWCDDVARTECSRFADEPRSERPINPPHGGPSSFNNASRVRRVIRFLIKGGTAS